MKPMYSNDFGVSGIRGKARLNFLVQLCGVHFLLMAAQLYTMDTMNSTQSARNHKVTQPRRTPSPSGGWRVRWRLDGKEKMRNFDTAILADNFIAEVMVARNIPQAWDADTCLPVDWKRTNTTLVSAAADYLAAHKDAWAENTFDTNLQHLAAFCLVYGYSDVIELTPEHRAQMRAVLTGQLEDNRTQMEIDLLDKRRLASRESKLHEGVSQSTQTSRRRNLGSFLRWCVDVDLLDEVPLPARKRTRSTKKGDVIDVKSLPSIAECRAAIRRIPQEHWRVMFTTMLMTGVRTGEARALRVSDVLPSSDLIIDETAKAVSGHTNLTGPTKTGSDRTISLDADTFQMLNDWIATNKLSGDDFLFQNENGEPWHTSTAQRAFKAVMDERNYVLRHVHATALIQAGIPLTVVAHRLGHSVLTLTTIYAGLIASGDHRDAIAAALT